MRWFHIFIWAVLATKVLAQGVLFNAGDSYMIEFSSLSYSRPVAFPNEPSGSGHFLVVFPPYAVGDGDSFLLEAFADSLADTPKSRVFTFPENQLPDGVYLGFLWWPGYELFWPDLQGIVRFTMLTGSAEVTSFSIRQIVDGSVYEQSFVVPEPSTWAFFSLGLVLVLSLQLRGDLPPNALKRRPALQLESRGLRRRVLAGESHGRFHSGAAVAQF